MQTPPLVVIDDDPAQLELSCLALGQILPELTIHRIHASHRFTAELADDAHPVINDQAAAVLIDYYLSRATATQLIPALRSRIGEHVPVVVFSHTTDSRLEQEAVAAGAVALVAKPFSMDEVRRLVQQLRELCPRLRVPAEI
jgi:two-component system sensor histidine kinase/response regulator